MHVQSVFYMCFLVSRTCRFAAIGCFAIFYDSVFHTMLATISRQRIERFQKAKRRTTNQINNDTFLSVTRNDPSPPSCGLYVEIRRFYGTVLETQPDDNCSDGTCSSDGMFCFSLLMLVYSLVESEVMSGFQTLGFFLVILCLG